MTSKLPTLTENNHFRFGYNGDWFRFRESPEDRWTVAYGRARYLPKNFKAACYDTATHIFESSGDDPIYVLFSGGIDSEVALRSFHEQGLPVCAAILQLKNNYNLHDIAWAIVVCEQLDIQYRVIELDIMRFWEAEVYEYAMRTQCRSPQLCATMWLADQLDGYPVLGSGECFLVRDDSGLPSWHMQEKELIASWYRHFIVRQRDAAPGFFQYTPEIMLAYLRDRMVEQMVHDSLGVKHDTSKTLKLPMYQQFFHLMPRIKYSGFEKIHDHDARVRKKLEEMFPDSGAIARTDYEDLKLMLTPEGMTL